jgi:hypothetical protein
LKVDIFSADRHVSKVPKAEVARLFDHLIGGARLEQVRGRIAALGRPPAEIDICFSCELGLAFWLPVMLRGSQHGVLLSGWATAGIERSPTCWNSCTWHDALHLIGQRREFESVL